MSKQADMQKTYLAPGDVAKMLMVSPATIRHWASKGELAAVSTPGGHRRFLRHDIERFARDNDLTMLLPGSGVLRILIVDDDTHVANYLSEFFRRLDANTESMEAHDGYNAGRLVQAFRPHVVLLDLMMPELDGFQVCRQIKKDPTSRATRVIAMTGFFDEENVARSLSAGAEYCIEKPFNMEKLLTILGIRNADTFDANATTNISK